MFLCKEITDYSLQFLSGRLPHGVIPPEAGGQTETVINAKDDKQHCRCSHYDSPCMKSRLMRRCTGSLALVDEDSCKIDKKSGSHQFGYIVESTLPSDILSLILFRQFGHIQSVKGYVMCRTAEGYHSENSYTHCKERRQMKGKSDTRKSDTAHNLSGDDYDSFV